MEMILMSGLTFDCQGRMAMEWVIDRIKTEAQDFSTEAMKLSNEAKKFSTEAKKHIDSVLPSSSHSNSTL